MISGLLGVIHLLPLPGDPLCSPHAAETYGFARIHEAALYDAEALVKGGVDGLVIENFGSAPFPKGDASQRVPPHHIACMTLLVRELMQRYPTAASGQPLQIGVNCLRNDIFSALAIAAACGLGRPGRPGFVRVNVHTGAYVTDQGLIEGEAYHSLRYRQSLGAQGVKILADVLVKHAKPLVPVSATTATQDCLHRGLADGVVVTGAATGAEVSSALLEEVRRAAGEKPLLIGSGFSPAQAASLAPLVHGAIVGTWVKQKGQVHLPVDIFRVRELVAAVQGRFRRAE